MAAITLAVDGENAEGEPPSVSDLVNQGLDLVHSERFDEALQCFDRAVCLNPDNADAWHNRGRTLHWMERAAMSKRPCAWTRSVSWNGAKTPPG